MGRMQEKRIVVNKQLCEENKGIKMKWNKNIKPSLDICPEQYCFFWAKQGDFMDTSGVAHESLDKAFEYLSHNDGWLEVKQSRCSCRFGTCKRLGLNKDDRDWYEPCEPELKKDGLPWFYFISSIDKLTSEARKKYLKDSKEYWNSE
jgi:hypothetical protein